MMGLTSLLVERLTELSDIPNFSKFEIQYYNTNILISLQGKSILYRVIMCYMRAVFS